MPRMPKNFTATPAGYTALIDAALCANLTKSLVRAAQLGLTELTLKVDGYPDERAQATRELDSDFWKIATPTEHLSHRQIRHATYNAGHIYRAKKPRPTLH